MAVSASSSNSVSSAYLRSLTIEPLRIETLSGGTTNQLWRVLLDETSVADANRHGLYIIPGTKSIIVKHAEPFVFHNPNVPFPVDRMSFEATALEHLQSDSCVSLRDLQVQTPVLHHHDIERNCLMMSDAGESTLKEAYKTMSQFELTEVGTELGRWLAALHWTSRSWDIGPQGNITARQIYRYSYRNLSTALQHWGFSETHPQLAADVDEKYGSLLQSEDDGACMGDFWPGNIILGRVSAGLGSQTTSTLTVIDWEMVRRGCGATDVGQFLAEAMLLERFQGSTVGNLARPFYHAYMQEGERLSANRPAPRFINRVHVHCGVHLVFWPSVVRWGSFEESQKMAQLGIEVLQQCLRHRESSSSSLLQLLQTDER